MPDGIASDSMVFTSWKEIASYLGKGVRTVQRWEAQFGLPVQRPNAHTKGIVRATREELDRWIATRWSQRSGKLELPDGPVELGPAIAIRPMMAELEVPTKAGIEAMEELRMRNRTLVVGLRQLLEQLAHNCHDLALNVQLGRELALLHSSPVISAQSSPPSLYPAHKQAKAD